MAPATMTRAAALLAAMGACVLAHGNHKHGVHSHQHSHGHSHTHAHDSAFAGVPRKPEASPTLLAKPFDLTDYQLTPGSRFYEQTMRNLQYLTSYNLTNLVCQYTSAANLTGTYANPTCTFMDLNGYSGHYLGHYLSATAMLGQNLGPAGAKAKSDSAAVVNSLAQVQTAWTAAGQPGFVFSYNTIPWDNLLGPNAENCAPICVPFYIYHKMLQGMLDQYTRLGNQQAYTVMMGMVDWIVGRIADTLSRGGMGLWQNVLNTEWGGMNDVLYKIYQLTGNETLYQTAYLFNHWSWTSPFILGQDGLPGNHANTHIPEIIGDALAFELDGNTTKATIVNTFFYYLNSSHTFATGGSNDHEHWGDANRLGDQMDDQTEESCTTYNILKLARSVFTWSGGQEDTRWADFYERALFNGIVGNQATTGRYEGTDTTGFIYMLPLGGPGLTKPWGDSDYAQPCCWGTLSETFSKLGDSVMFSDMSDSTLFVNLFVPLTLTWAARGGAVIRQDTSYPYDPASTTALTIVNPGSKGATWTLALRVPFWATNTNTVTVNGQAVAQPIVPGQYLNITRAWAAGDVVKALFTPSLRWEPLNDNRPDLWGGVGAIMYGGILMAGVNVTTDGMPIDPTQPLAGQVQVNPNAPAGTLQFLAPVYGDACGPNGTQGLVNATLIPLMDVAFEQYSVYWHTKNVGPAVIPYNNTPSFTVPTAVQHDLMATGGSSLITNGPDLNIRSGDPSQTNIVFSSYVIKDSTHTLTGFNFTYRYVAGYGPAGAPGGTNFSLVLLPGCDMDPNHAPTPLAVLYQSPVLADYPFDTCNTCYSPPITAYAPPGSMAVPVSGEGGARVALIFQDNQRNVQLDLPLGLTFWWSGSGSSE